MFVVVDRDGRLGQLGVEEGPKVVEVNTRALHRTTTPTLPTEDQLLILGAQEVGHGLKIKQQGWSIIQLYSVRVFLQSRIIVERFSITLCSNVLNKL